MSFLIQESTVFMTIKLTDTGRRLLSLGQLTFDKLVISDREVDYSLGRNNFYSITSNRVLSPKDDNPRLPPNHFDGTTANSLVGNLFGNIRTFTSSTASTGFYSGTTSYDPVSNIVDYKLDSERWLGTAITDSSNFLSGRTLTIDSSTYSPGEDGHLAFIVFSHPEGAAPADYRSISPFVSLWYRVTGGTTQITVDRELPDFNGVAGIDCHIYYYPWNGVRGYYGSAFTNYVQVWNMNIVRSSSEIGTVRNMSGYTVYGSAGYNGQKQYFGFNNDYRQIGFVHFTNEYSGNTYGEELLPRKTVLDIPHIMWHRKPAIAGTAEQGGQRFTDEGSNILFDPIAETTYTLLRDENTADGVVVGRVYPRLKMIAITDPELLTALSYKSNRNWTLPPLELSLSTTPKPPLTVDNFSGLCRSGKTYYVTYYASWGNDYVASTSFGYQESVHCGYISKIDGAMDENGFPQFLSAKFPPRAFPYLRDETGMAVYSGTGWNCNSIKLMVKEVDKNQDFGVDNVGSTGWKLLESYGNFYDGEVGDNTIQADLLTAFRFIASQQDYDAAPEYEIGEFFTQNMDYTNQTIFPGLTYGNEAFFFGNIKVDWAKTVYQTVALVQCMPDQYNISNNSSFTSTTDHDTYITEVGILNENNELVAVGKNSQPIKKNDDQYIIMQLQLDF